MEQPITAVIGGLGVRGYEVYASYARRNPDKIRIVAVADPDPAKRTAAREAFGLAEESCYESMEALLEAPRLGDVAVIATQDRQHVRHAVPAMEKGYHLLLEKPVSPDLQECLSLRGAAHRYQRIVAVAHVLRYTQIFSTVKQLLDANAIGRLIHMDLIENVAYWHFAHSFVRGLWNNSDETSPMILAKCCHDLDIILWLMGQDCRRVSSFGSLMTFMEQNAPEGCTGRCIDGCAIQDSCPYDALKIYLTGKQGLEQLHGGWPVTAVVLEPDREKLMEALRSGPYGRCVYHCNNNVVDHQVVNMEFMDGVTASLTMCGFTAEVTREIKIMGTLGEINGDMDRNVITVKRFGEEEDVIDVTKLTTDLSGHGGGENRLLRDLFHMVEGVGSANTALTSIDKSVQSHIMAFAAERSRLENGRPVDLDEIYRECNAPNTLAI